MFDSINMKCPICESKTYEHQHPRFNMKFHCCPTCEFIFKDELIHPSPEDEYQIYEQHQNDEGNQGYINFLTNFIDAAVYPLIQQGDVLDFGSGPNPVLAKILKDTYGFQVDIYDPYYAREVIFKNKTYDLITSTEVVEHFYHPIPMFETLSKHIKSKGFLALMTLFHPNDLKLFNDWFYIRDITHVSFYTPKTFKYIAQRFGFHVIYTNHHRYITLQKD